MGFRYRKSINFGHGFRISISQSGIGYSFGVKGARITKTARGTVRATTYISGTGLSYVTETKIERSERKKTLNSRNTEDLFPNVAVEDVRGGENVNAEEYQSAEYADVLNQIRVVRYAPLIYVRLCSAFSFSDIWFMENF